MQFLFLIEYKATGCFITQMSFDTLLIFSYIYLRSVDRLSGQDAVGEFLHFVGEVAGKEFVPGIIGVSVAEETFLSEDLSELPGGLVCRIYKSDVISHHPGYCVPEKRIMQYKSILELFNSR